MTADIIEAAKRVCAWITEEDICDIAEYLGGGNYDSFEADMIDLLEAVKELESQPAPAAHPDDEAVDRFAAAMKAKLAKKRDEGRGGWDNPEECSIGSLSYMLIQHVWKGDPIDVGNLAMMIHQRDSRIAIDDEARGIMPAPAADTGQAVAKARAAVERLANTPMNLSLEDWCVLSADILKGLDAARPAPLDAERVREAWAYRVHDFHIARSPVKARAKFPESTEHLYPANRHADAIEMARLLGGTCTPLYPPEDAR